jgi:host factor-I protein
MAVKPVSLQDQFLNSARRSKAPLTLYLLKGVKLQGIITWFDAFSLLLRRDAQAQLVYKHSISTITAAKPIDMGGVADSAPGARPSLQESFLASATGERSNLTLFLVNGVMLQGRVKLHDQFSLLLERGAQEQLVYKHAISTIQPEVPLDLAAIPEDGQAE